MWSSVFWLSVVKLKPKISFRNQEDLKLKQRKFPKLRQNAENKMMIPVSFASDWLREGCKFSGKISTQSEAKIYNLWLAIWHSTALINTQFCYLIFVATDWSLMSWELNLTLPRMKLFKIKSSFILVTTR